MAQTIGLRHAKNYRNAFRHIQKNAGYGVRHPANTEKNRKGVSYCKTGNIIKGKSELAIYPAADQGRVLLAKAGEKPVGTKNGYWYLSIGRITRTTFISFQ